MTRLLFRIPSIRFGAKMRLFVSTVLLTSICCTSFTVDARPDASSSVSESAPAKKKRKKAKKLKSEKRQRQLGVRAARQARLEMRITPHAPIVSSVPLSRALGLPEVGDSELPSPRLSRRVKRKHRDSFGNQVLKGAAFFAAWMLSSDDRDNCDDDELAAVRADQKSKRPRQRRGTYPAILRSGRVGK